MNRRALFAILMMPLLKARGALARGGPRGNDPERSAWFAKQTNMDGGWCCNLGDAHGLDPGDVRYDAETGLYSVRLPPLNGEKEGEWITIPAWKMRDPKGGPPPVPDPLVWFDADSAIGTKRYYRVWCFEPNAQL